jgi:hypothetical protein
VSTRRWLGGAPAIQQVNTFTFGGTWVVGETITFTYGSLAWTYAVTSTTIATFLPLLEAAYEALAADEYPAHAEQTADSTSTTLTLTADTAGVPFTVTVATNSAAGTINGGASTTGTATTASSGPNDWSTAANWSGAAVPVNSDDVVLDDPTWDILYGLAQSAVTLTSLLASSSFEGRVGLPKINEAGNYPEYRPDYLAVSSTNVYVGRGGGGDGSARFKLDVGSVACTCDVYLTGSGEDENTEAFLFKGTSASNVLRTHGDAEVGVAVYGGEAANLSGGVTLNGGASARFGSGVTLAVVVNNGSVVEINSAVGTSLTQDGGSCVINGTGAVAQLTIRNGYVAYNTTGTLGGSTLLTGDGTLDFTRDLRGKTVTNPVERQSDVSQVIDDFFVVNVGGNFVVDNNHCAANGLRLGTNVRVTRAATA